MKTSHLHDIWAGPDNSRLTKAQFSFRLPVHIAAKLAALCEIYPTKNRTQIVADLLTAALDDLEKNLPSDLGNFSMHADAFMAAELEMEEGTPLYELGGVRGTFRRLANKHFAEIEQELGNDSPPILYQDYLVSEAEIQKRK